MSKKYVNKNNHISLQGWMITELDLKGNELIVYAIIYGFSQIEGNEFTGSANYMAAWCNTSRRTIMNVLKELLAKNLIIKRDVKNEDNSRYCNYRVNPKFVFGELEKSSQGDVKNFPEKCEKFSHHNIVHTIDTYNREFITNSLLDFNSQIDNLDSFTQTIESWLSYKKSRKQSYASNVTILAFIKKLIKFSSGKHLLAKEIVENSIANNWAGIYELKGNNSKVSNPIIEQVEPTIFDDNYKIVSEEQQEEYIQQMRERRLKGGTNK